MAFEPVFSLGSTMMESFARLNQVERLVKKLPGLDCGSCGAPTCKALAEDIVRGGSERGRLCLSAERQPA
ncbi:(Fe-S)-binding protein [Clostridium sp. AM58-1XD]|uniref:(Fe-S)-binding protein n=1 Tax=Clostridium sp. AM58-1XD TaxID=2292307 RepID=UPI00325AC774